MNDTIKFCTNGNPFELTAAQVNAVYQMQERQYLREDAWTQIEMFTEKHPEWKEMLHKHTEEIVDVFMDTQDENVANSVTWQAAISEIFKTIKEC